MYLVLFFCFVFSFVNAESESNEGKYIDLLPEKEKKEFLEKIARRILKEVQSKDDKIKKSAEISDSQLNAHSEYVSKILKEERQNLRKSNTEIDDFRDEKDEHKSEDEESRVQELKEERFTENNNKSSSIDLTLRGGKISETTKIEIDPSLEIVTEVIITSKVPGNNLPAEVVNDVPKDGNISIEITFEDESKDSSNVRKQFSPNEAELNEIPVKVIYSDELSTKNKPSTLSKPIDLILRQKKTISNTITLKPGNETDVPLTAKKENTFLDSENNMSGTKMVNLSAEEERDVRNELETPGLSDLLTFTTIAIAENFTTETSTVSITEAGRQITETIFESVEHSDDNDDQRSLNIRNNKTVLDEFTENISVVFPVASVTEVTNVTTNKIVNAESYDVGSSASSSVEFDPAMHATNVILMNDSNKNKTNKDAKQTTESPKESSDTVRISFVSQLKKPGLVVNDKLKTDKDSTKTKPSAYFMANPENMAKKSNIILTKIENNDPVTANIDNLHETHKSKILSKALKTAKKEIETLKNKLRNVNKNYKTVKSTGREHIQTALKEVFTEINFETQVEESKKYLPSQSKKVKTLNVFEIPPGMPPFVQQTINKTKLEEIPKIEEEEPFFVPVYNYAPENAYFNPHNHFGPDSDDADEETQIKHSRNTETNTDNYELLSTYKKIYDLAENKEKYKTYNFGQVMNLEKLLKISKEHEYDAIDINKLIDDDDFNSRPPIDPNILLREHRRKHKFFHVPDSNEEHHPFNYMHRDNDGRGKKTHIHLIKQILMDNRIFGYKPPYSTPSEPFSTYAKATTTPLPVKGMPNSKLKFIRSRLDNNFNILRPPRTKEVFEKPVRSDAFDFEYYFSRTESKEETRPRVFHSDKKRFKLNKKESLVDTSYFNTYEKKKLIESKEIKKYYGDFSYINPYGKNFVAEFNDIKSKYMREKCDEPDNKKPEEDSNEETKKKLMISLNDARILLNISDTRDVFTALDMILPVKMSRTRIHNDDTVDLYLNVVEDMLRNDNPALNQYDWLGTTVDIQSALKKLIDLTNQLQYGQNVHPSDVQLLKYVLYLYNLSQSHSNKKLEGREGIESDDRVFRPRNYKKKGIKLIKDFERAWLIRMSDKLNVQQNNAKDYLVDFKLFLINLRNTLNDLHDAIKHIALVTKFKNQNWYKNLKELYFAKLSRKKLLEVTIHLVTVRVVSLLEESATEGAENDYVRYTKKNKKKVDRTLDEFDLILSLLKDYQRIYG